MLQLNKKGFAISTILYGILSIMILLLISILAFLKSTKTLNTSFSGDIEKKLNECVTDEIIVENCYATGSTNCDRTAYYSCIGIMEETQNPINEYPVIKDKLLPLVVTTGNGLYADGTTGRYIYRGTDVNNYISFDDRLWRIVAIESDGSTKIMLTGYSTPLPWDTEEEATDWKSSTLKNFLDTIFYPTVADNSSKLVKKPWDVGVVYEETVAVTQSELEDKVDDIQYVGQGTAGTVGLISATDYLKASLVDCSTNALKNTTCNSWMSGGAMWIINPYVLITNRSLVLAGIIDSDHSIKGQSTATSISFSPVLFLNERVKIKSGVGSAGSPYILD